MRTITTTSILSICIIEKLVIINIIWFFPRFCTISNTILTFRRHISEWNSDNLKYFMKLAESSKCKSVQNGGQYSFFRSKNHKSLELKDVKTRLRKCNLIITKKPKRGHSKKFQQVQSWVFDLEMTIFAHDSWIHTQLRKWK